MTTKPDPDYYEGKGCQCYARSSGECGCPDVDWTPKEVYDLRAENARLRDMIERAIETLAEKGRSHTAMQLRAELDQSTSN